MDYRACIQQSIDYIETHLKQQMAVEELAALVGFSSYHYYRVFDAYVGLPVMEYIRCRRIAHAAAELASSRRILDIALDYGFDTHAGFTRAFSRIYGLSPEKYRFHASGCLPEKVDLMRLAAHYKISGGIIMQPKIMTKSAFKVAGYALETTSEGGENSREIPAFWQRYMLEGWGTVLHEKIAAVSHDEYGICFSTDMQTGRFTYCIGVEVPTFENLPKELITKEVPTANYAVFSTLPAARADFVAAIQNTWRFIYNEWLPTSGYEFAENCADFERYGDTCMGDENLVMEIYIPIKKREER